MRLRHTTRHNDGIQNKKKGKCIGKVAATVATVALMAIPLVEKAKAQENPKPPAATEAKEEKKAPEKAGTTTFWEGIRKAIKKPMELNQPEEKKAEGSKDKKTEEPAKPKPEDDSAGEIVVPEHSIQPAAEEKPAWEVHPPRKSVYDKPSKGESKEASPEKPTEKLPAAEPTEGEEEYGEDMVLQKLDYTDAALTRFDDSVDITGRPRTITLSHDWDMGGKVIANEAGSSVSASLRFRKYGALSAGNIWFGEQAAPFATLTGGYAQNLWRLKFLYLGRISALGNMPSQLYTSHSLGMGYSQPIGNWRLRLAGIIGGALSYPAYDDIYLNFVVGASVEWNKKLLIYAVPEFYFAAKTPQESIAAKYYWPRFQNVHTGVEYRVYDDYAGRIFARVGVLGETYGVRVTRSINFAEDVAGDLWVSAGANRFIEPLGGRWDFVVTAGMRLVIGGRHVNSTMSARYDHLESGGVAHAETDFPTQENLGPYGFGRSGNAVWDNPINDAKQSMIDASSFQEWAAGFQDYSEEDKIRVARFIGAFLQQVAYANGAYDALMESRFFDSEVDRIAGATNDDIFAYLKRYVDWYNHHGLGEELPEDLRNGIAVCGGINGLMAEFLRANGVPALVASVNTWDGPHVVAIPQPGNKTLLLDYGNEYKTPAGTFDQTIRFYGQNQKAPTFQSQLFDENGYLGTRVTGEGRLLHWTIGIPNTEVLMKAFLGVR
jgi:hypothetical protein